MRVLLLGSGTSVPAERSAPGLLVVGDSTRLLIDPGPGALHRLGAAMIEPTSVDEIVLTHFHPDHVNDLVPFLFSLKNPRYGEPPWPRLIGPSGLRAFYSQLRQPFERWLPTADELPLTELSEDGTADEGLTCGEFCLRGKKVQHLPFSLAWHITDIRGSTFAFSGDTAECPGVVEAARDADLLMLECSAPLGFEVRGHLEPNAASRVVRDSRARRVVLVHLNPECATVDLVGQFAEDVRDRVELGRDGVWYEVEGAERSPLR